MLCAVLGHLFPAGEAPEPALFWPHPHLLRRDRERGPTPHRRQHRTLVATSHYTFSHRLAGLALHGHRGLRYRLSVVQSQHSANWPNPHRKRSVWWRAALGCTAGFSVFSAAGNPGNGSQHGPHPRGLAPCTPYQNARLQPATSQRLFPTMRKKSHRLQHS